MPVSPNASLSGQNKIVPERVERDLAILALRSEGKVYREIAAELGIGKGTVNRVLTTAEVPEVLQEAFRRVVAMAPKVVQNYQDLLDSTENTFKLAASRDVAKMIGLAPATTGSPVAQTLNITNNIQVNIATDNRALAAIDGLLAPPVKQSTTE